MSRHQQVQRTKDLLEEKGYRCINQIITKGHKSHQVIEKYQGRGPAVILEVWYDADDDGINWNQVQLCDAYVLVKSDNTWDDFIGKLQLAIAQGG